MGIVSVYPSGRNFPIYIPVVEKFVVSFNGGISCGELRIGAIAISSYYSREKYIGDVPIYIP